jgi:PAS domain S-box-containing protein
MAKTRAHLQAELDDVRAQLDACRGQYRRTSMESKLQDVQRRYDELFGRMRDGCGLHEIVLDDAGHPVDYRFLAVNEAFGRLTGLDPEAVIGRTVREFLPGLEQSWFDKFGQVALTGVPMHFEQHSGPLERDYAVTAFSPEYGKFVVVFDDVTERKRLYTQLRQAQKMEAVGQLAGGIAHDFRNILTIILALGEAMQDHLPADATELRADLADLLAAANRGTEITRKLLGFSRMEQLSLQRVELGTVVKEVTGILRRVLPATIHVEHAVPANAAVHGDPNALHHVLLNLANNARDAMPMGGRLSLTCDGQPIHRADGVTCLCLCVRDTGEGMDQATLERVFDPFFTTKPPGQGTGLGLAMVYGLVREQGGAVEVESAPGKGTEIRVYLPQSTAARVQPEARQDALPHGTETILFAEDEAPLRSVAQRALERLGYRVLLAADGEEALQMFYAHEGEIDLVISDSVMPKLGGVDVYEALRNHEPPIRFLIASGYSPTSVGQPHQPSVRIPFLRKPWTLSELARRVRDVLDDETGPQGAPGE